MVETRRKIAHKEMESKEHDFFLLYINRFILLPNLICLSRFFGIVVVFNIYSLLLFIRYMMQNERLAAMK